MALQPYRLGVVAVMLLVATASAACDATSPMASDPGDASGGPAASLAAGNLERMISDAVANASPLGLSRADRDVQDTIDEQSGLAAALGPELHDWLQEQRSAAGVVALEARGIDPASLGPTGISSGLIASTDLGLTAATGLGWIGTGIVATGLVRSGSGSVGGSAPSSSGPGQVTAETTVGDLHMAVTITVTTQIQVSGSRVIADADAVEAVTTTSVSTGAAIGTSTSHNRIHVEADLCPNANGGVPVVVTSDWSEDASGMPGGGAFNLHSTIDTEGTVNDAAYLVSTTTTVDSTFQGTSAGTTRSGSATTSWSQSMGSGGSRHGGTVSSATGSIAGSYTVQEAMALQGLSSIMPWLIAGDALDVAQDGWRGGKCVEIIATERSRTVAIREIVPFTAQPRHKIEGTDLDKQVVASFRGELSVDPVDVAVDAPAAFTYAAPPTDRRAGVITLTSTSNRGIGMLDIVFTPEYQGWKVDGSFTNAVGARGSLLGTKCGNDPGGQWTAAGKYEFLGFEGRQLWTIDLDASPTAIGNQFVYEGTYSYRDDSTGPYGVQQRTRVTGTVAATVDETDGSVRMVLTEKTRKQTAKAPGGGWGSGPSKPQPTGPDLVWTADAGC